MQSVGSGTEKVPILDKVNAKGYFVMKELFSRETSTDLRQFMSIRHTDTTK